VPIQYCDPSKFAQLSAGEISSDQAVPHFSYKDNNENLDIMAGLNFFDPVGDALEVGSTIKLSGLVSDTTFINTPTLIVSFKGPAPEGVGIPYKWEIDTSLGPNSLYCQDLQLPNPPPPAPLLGSIPILQDMQCKFKGFLLLHIPAMVAGLSYARDIQFNLGLGIKANDMSWGVMSANSTGPTPPAPLTLTDTWTSADNVVTYRFQNNNAVSSVDLDAYVYSEVHAPMSPIF